MFNASRRTKLMLKEWVKYVPRGCKTCADKLTVFSKNVTFSRYLTLFAKTFHLRKKCP